MFTGIDISHWQGNVDFNKVKKSGIDFVIIKAGGSDNGFYEDIKFKSYYKQAKDAGLYVGCYYFAGPKFLGDLSGESDAKRFLRIIGGLKFEFPVYIDVELTSFPIDKFKTTSATISFCRYMEYNKYYCGIYASDISGFRDMLDLSRLDRFDKWVARYGSSPKYVKSYGMYQYRNSGFINGIHGKVDLDCAYKNYPHIIKLNHLNGY